MQSLICINTNSLEFQKLQKVSGVPSSQLEAICRGYYTRYNRFPMPDEIIGADSTNYIKDTIKLSQHNSAKIEDILKGTGTSSINEAMVKLNNQFTDKQIKLIELGNTAMVEIVPKPTSIKKLNTDKIDIDENINNTIVMNQIIGKLSKMYGVQLIPINNDIINQQFNNIPNASTSNAFIYQGNIYINTDNASVDAPIHELLHMLFGSMRYTNPDLYFNMIQKSEQFNSYNRIAQYYSNRTKSDIDEEVFVTELANKLSGKESALNDIDKSDLYEINHQVKQTLDNILMGDYSTKSIDNSQLYLLSLKQIANIVNSSSLNNNFQGVIDQSTVKRMLSNKKMELMKNNLLQEDCK